jgi:hypothetical protein
MPKVTNTFLKSKLNKDLDARLIPNGEYRDALNVQVSRSESDSVGSLENVLGNSKDSDFPTGTKCIGQKADEASGMVYLFFTNYTDSSSSKRSYSVTALNYIYEYNVLNNTKILLVQGGFLNFSTTNPIYGINVIENLLFWTDNRNQPRKINITLARPTLASGVPSYYTKEDQISVAKYNPYNSIDLFQEVGLGTNVVETTMKDVTSKFYPNGGSAISTLAISSGVNSFTTSSVNGEILETTNPYASTGSSVSYIDSAGSIVNIAGATVTIVSYAAGPPEVITITITGATFPALDASTEIIFNANDYYDKDFAGDPDYLKDRFARFSYRFKFDDGEYSLIAPFTQIAFIPKQDGYFMYVKKDGINTVEDQANAYRSTVVSFVENKVDNIKLRIPQPSDLTISQTIPDALKITEVDIVYKESNELALKIIETVPINDLTVNTTYACWEYIYKSQKPSRVLPSDEITRVYDKIPVRAFAQESSGNRIMYGNFQNKHTPPATIDYNVAATVKSVLNLKNGVATADESVASGSNNFDLKLGSGFIGVGSTIIGTNIALGTVVTQITGAGSFADPYTNVAFSPVSTGAITDGTAYNFIGAASDDKTTSITEYPSSSLKQNRNYQVGVVLSDRYGRQSTVILSEKPTTVYLPYNSDGVAPESWPGDSLKIQFNSQIGITNPDHNINYPGLYNGNDASANYNPLGWYSYKIVVKQTQQDYYNVYLPGIMASYPENQTLELGSTSHTVLINDNINKVPRDLTEIGPDQKQFRSSVQLFGRVENTNTVITYANGNPTNIGKSNKQYYSGTTTDTASVISNVREMFDYNPSSAQTPNLFLQFYDNESNPLIARISTSKKIGQISTHDPNTGTTELPGLQYLAVYETEPVDSLLDIYWETTTSGLISDLNNTINTGTNVGATQIENFNASSWTEAIAVNGNISTAFNLANSIGTNIILAAGDTFTLENVINNNGVNVNFGSSPYFELIPVVANQTFNVKVLDEYFDQIFFSNDSAIRSFTFNFKAVINNISTFFTITGGPSNISVDLSIQSGFPVNAGTITTNRYNIGTIGVFNGTNGSANSSGLAATGGLRVKDLEYSITNQKIVGDTFDRQTPYFVLTTAIVGAQNALKATMQNLISPVNTGVKHYTITTQLSDAGSSATHQFFLNLGINVTNSFDYKLKRLFTLLFPRTYNMVLIEVSAPSASGATAIPNTIGYYIRSGNWFSTKDPEPLSQWNPARLDLLASSFGGGDDFTPISLNRIGAATTVPAASSSGNYRQWIFSTTKQGAIDLWEQTLPTGLSGGEGTSEVVFDYEGNGGFTYEVIYN